VGFIAFLSGF